MSDTESDGVEQCPECGGDVTLLSVAGDAAALVCDDCGVEL